MPSEVVLDRKPFWVHTTAHAPECDKIASTSNGDWKMISSDDEVSNSVGVKCASSDGVLSVFSHSLLHTCNDQVASRTCTICLYTFEIYNRECF